MRNAKFVDHESKLALTLGPYSNWYFPYIEERVYVARGLKAEDFPLFFGRGTYGVNFFGNMAVVHVVTPFAKTYYFDLDDEEQWQAETVTAEIKKPRVGKRQGQRYDWYYQDGKWRKTFEGDRYWQFRGGAGPATTFAGLVARAVVRGATHIVSSAFDVRFLWVSDGEALDDEAIFQWDRQKHWWALLTTSAVPHWQGLPMGAVPIRDALDVWEEKRLGGSFAEQFAREAYNE